MKIRNVDERKRRGVDALPALLAVILLAGCNQHKVQGGVGEVIAPPGTISVYQLAQRLGLSVVQASQWSATLEGRGNCVMFFADPKGQAYVNGRPVGNSGGIVCLGNQFFVPRGLETPIRFSLRGAYPRIETPAEAPVGPPVPADLTRAGLVVIDPGHGGQDPGAASANGLREKDLVLAVARAVTRKLRQRGATVLMTRQGDSFVELDDRAGIANRTGAELFVSIHADSAPRNHSACGYTLYVSRSAPAKALAAADTIARSLAPAGLANRGIRRADYRVLVNTNCPAVLIEMGFLSNTFEAARLDSSIFQDRLADAIADGVARVIARR